MIKPDFQELIRSLEFASSKMKDAGEKMKSFQAEHPEIFQHGCELLNAADMVDEWVLGICNELEEKKTD